MVWFTSYQMINGWLPLHQMIVSLILIRLFHPVIYSCCAIAFPCLQLEMKWVDICIFTRLSPIVSSHLRKVILTVSGARISGSFNFFPLFCLYLIHFSVCGHVIVMVTQALLPGSVPPTFVKIGRHFFPLVCQTELTYWACRCQSSTGWCSRQHLPLDLKGLVWRECDLTISMPSIL